VAGGVYRPIYEVRGERCMAALEDYGKDFGLLGLSHVRVCGFAGLRQLRPPHVPLLRS